MKYFILYLTLGLTTSCIKPYEESFMDEITSCVEKRNDFEIEFLNHFNNNNDYTIYNYPMKSPKIVCKKCEAPKKKER